MSTLRTLQRHFRKAEDEAIAYYKEHGKEGPAARRARAIWDEIRRKKTALALDEPRKKTTADIACESLDFVIAMAEEMSSETSYGHGDEHGNYLGPRPEVLRHIENAKKIRDRIKGRKRL